MTVEVKTAIPKTAFASIAGAPLEWWFLQGFVEGPRLGRREVMASLFRYAGKDGADGHMLLVASLDPATGTHRLTSRVSAPLVEQFLKNAGRTATDAGLDRRLVDAMIEEVAANGPLRPVERVAEAARLDGEPFRIDWAGFDLAERHGDIRLALDLPEGEGRLAARLTPAAPWLDETGLGGENGIGRFAYVSCPRLAVFGTCGGEEVTGEFWFDHQFGGLGWLQSEDERRVPLGWVWFGINLDDGRSLLVMVHRDMEEDADRFAFAVLFDDTGTQLARQVEITGADPWASPATAIAYPLGWRIAVPEFDAALDFSPLAPDQEIPVFGLMTAIWEGAGRVSGTLAGQPVTGRARLELHGFGYGLDYPAWRRRAVARIDARIAEFFPKVADGSLLERYLGPARWAYDLDTHSAMLHRPVWDLLERGGKHWRPVLGLLLLDALGVPVAPHEAMMSVVAELIHTASLIIDDIEDASTTRRGEPTVHERFGLPTAINAANTLYFLPMLTVTENAAIDTAQRDAIRGLLVDLMVRGHFGQAQDIYWSELAGPARRALWGDPELEGKILQGYAFKTGAGIRGMAEVAAIVAGLDAATRDRLGRFGETFGVAFQIVDDVNNFSAAPEWGKERGEDLFAAKATFVIARARAALAGADRQRFDALIDDPALFADAATRAEGIALVETSGVLRSCREYAQEMTEAAWDEIDGLLPPSRAKVMLRVLCRSLVEVLNQT